MGKESTSKQGRDGYEQMIARNKRARHDYVLEDQVESGIVLVGSEVKSLRGGKASIAEAYARIRNGELWLLGANIPEYPQANRLNHEPTRDRKLLLHRRQIDKLHKKMRGTALTLVPLELYFDNNGRVKVRLALARGKKRHDKRQHLKQADADRAMDRARKR